MTTEKELSPAYGVLRYARFRSDGYWYAVTLLATQGTMGLIAINRNRRGRRPQRWIKLDKLRVTRPALS